MGYVDFLREYLELKMGYVDFWRVCVMVKYWRGLHVDLQHTHTHTHTGFAGSRSPKASDPFVAIQDSRGSQGLLGRQAWQAG